MSADAIFFPARVNGRAFDAVAQAMTHTNVEPGSKLYTDGDRLAWLPRPLPGWFRYGAIERNAS